MLAAGGGAGSGPLEPGRVRASMEELARALDPRDLPPVQVHDRVLAGPGGPLPIRTYVPDDLPADPGPGLIFLHGGIGVFGSIQTHDAVCRMIAHDAAVRIVSVGYRLAPEHPFPAGLEDAWFATGWVADHAAALGIDRARLAIGGDSAGATLAIVVCLRARDAGAPALAAQLLLCPVTDLAFDTGSRVRLADGYFLSSAMLEWGIGLYCPPGMDRRDPRLSPLRAADLGRLPPAFIHTAEYDPMCDEGAAYARALDQAGVAVRYVCHAGLIHHYYGMAGAMPAARAALRDCAQALQRGLAGGG
jgi:acetyl esterase/lipase